MAWHSPVVFMVLYGWHTRVYPCIVQLSLEFAHTSKEIWVEPHEVFFGVNIACLSVVEFGCLLIGWSALLACVFLFDGKYMICQPCLLISLALPGIFFVQSVTCKHQSYHKWVSATEKHTPFYVSHIEA